MNKKKIMNSKRGSSETLRNETCLNYHWFAGLLDADGGFYVSRDRYVSCEITMHEKEIQTLHWIKQHLGGSVTPRTKKKAVRWRLHKREPLELLLKNLDGLLQTERLSLQYKKACRASHMVPKTRDPMSLNNAWLSGFFSGDGCFSINRSAGFQPSASISQKEKQVLDRIAQLAGGKVYPDVSWNGWVWWMDIRTHREILDYFQMFSLQNPLKQARLKSLIRFLGYLDRGLHKDPGSQARLHHFVRLFQKIEEQV
uniref:LAGLIDADG endonuclease n=1 Tax=Chlorella sp. ArM0029B TaxID=1415603 RepID=U5U5N9_9CHLO|nr:LAGLIDADG endonuclease [Chlorella sp. ArM0029B]